jgi:hypothetical protein
LRGLICVLCQEPANCPHTETQCRRICNPEGRNKAVSAHDFRQDDREVEPEQR